MYNKSLIPWFRYKPSRELIDRAKQVFMNSADEAGRPITAEESEVLVKRVLDTAFMPKGFRLDKPLMLCSLFPDFFLNRTSLKASMEGSAATTSRGSQIASIGALKSKADREIFEQLLGKNQNPMQTILAGTAKLSMIVRRNVFFSDLMKKNDELLQKAYKEIELTGKTNIKPMFVKR